MSVRVGKVFPGTIIIGCLWTLSDGHNATDCRELRCIF